MYIHMTICGRMKSLLIRGGLMFSNFLYSVTSLNQVAAYALALSTPSVPCGKGFLLTCRRLLGGPFLSSIACSFLDAQYARNWTTGAVGGRLNSKLHLSLTCCNGRWFLLFCGSRAYPRKMSRTIAGAGPNLPAVVSEAALGVSAGTVESWLGRSISLDREILQPGRPSSTATWTGSSSSTVASTFLRCLPLLVEANLPWPVRRTLAMVEAKCLRDGTTACSLRVTG